jgi:GH35 family endo-1,4-beta-xylanase
MYRVYLGQITSNKNKNQELLQMIEDLKEKGQLKDSSWRP